MKKATLIVSGICALICINNAFGMLIQKNAIRKITTYKKTQQFHTTPSAHYIDPLGAGAFILSTMNTFDISRNQTLLEKRIQELEETIKENEKKYNLALTNIIENKKDNE